MHRFYNSWLLLIAFFLVACARGPADGPSGASPADDVSASTLAAATAASPSPNPATPAPPTATPSPTAVPPTPTASLVQREAAADIRLWPGEMILATDVDDIPAIFASDDLFLSVEGGNAEWGLEELVIGVVVGGDARAYPIRLLSSHEIVNDVVGGRPVAVTWCPLCFTAIVFDRVLDREYTFGVSGFLYQDNLVMYDHQTNTFWSQLGGQAIRGALRSRRLNILPSLMTTWGEWQEVHPTTRVLSAVRVGQSADIVDPYAGYYASGAPGITGVAVEDDRLPPKALVVGVSVGRESRAYPLGTIADEGVVNDMLGNLPLALFVDEAFQSVVVYQRQVGDTFPVFAPTDDPLLVTDDATGSTWDIRTGTAVAGPSTGERLQRLGDPIVFWFAWATFHPGTEIYGQE